MEKGQAKGAGQRDVEKGQAKAKKNGQNQRVREKEGHTTRADAGPSCVEAPRQMHRLHMQ